MHTGLKCAALLLLIAPLGCRSQGELDLAERDMRLQENRIYRLQEYVQQYQHMLEDCQAENESLRKQLADSGKTPDTSSAKPRTLRELLNSNTNSSKKPSTSPESAGPDLNLPDTPSVDLGTEFDPALTTPEITPPPKKVPANNSPPNPPGFNSAPPAAKPGELPEPDELPSPSAGGATSPTTQLAIRAVGQVRGNSTMPDGLLVAIEPRSSQGGLARAPDGAKMSLMIVSATDEQPHGRWDYTAAQTSSAYRAGFGADNGWRFVVPFNKDNNPPAKLKLYARLTLADGSKLISERDFDADAGASLEEIPGGDAGWLRSERPIASLANKIGREARMMLNGPQARPRSGGPAGSASSLSSKGGNTAPAWQTHPMGSSSASTSTPGSSGGTAPAWQPQPVGTPSVSMGTPSAPGGTAPPFSPNTAPSWNLTNIPAAPAENKAPAASEAGAVPTAPVAETATRPDRPAWAPYR